MSYQSSSSHRLHPPHRWPQALRFTAPKTCPACSPRSTQHSPLSRRIKDENGKLRRFINIYVNDEDIRFLGGDTYAFQDGDEVMLIPSIAGGCCAHGE